MIHGFELAIGLVVRIGFVMEAAVGERTAEAFVEEQEQERDVNAFGPQTPVQICLLSARTIVHSTES
jgi:hypothetical protein